jgi:hypothetical protein
MTHHHEANSAQGPLRDAPPIGPHVKQHQEMGFLKPEKWNGRAPWFFRKTGDPEHPLVFNPNYDKQTFREITD